MRHDTRTQSSIGMTEAATASNYSGGLRSAWVFSLPDSDTIFRCEVHPVTLLHVIRLIELFKLLS